MPEEQTTFNASVSVVYSIHHAIMVLSAADDFEHGTNGGKTDFSWGNNPRPAFHPL